MSLQQLAAAKEGTIIIAYSYRCTCITMYIDFIKCIHFDIFVLKSLLNNHLTIDKANTQIS